MVVWRLKIYIDLIDTKRPGLRDMISRIGVKGNKINDYRGKGSPCLMFQTLNNIVMWRCLCKNSSTQSVRPNTTQYARTNYADKRAK